MCTGIGVLLRSISLGDIFNFALFAFGFQVILIWLLGAWSLWLYREGSLHRLFESTAAWPFPLAFLADLFFSVVTTFCGCMTQPALFALFQAEKERRALRFIALCSVGRVTLLGALWAVCRMTPQGGFAWLGMVGAAVASWALIFPLFFPDRGLISPASVFIRRHSSRPRERSVSDSLEKTRDMVEHYGLWLLAGALLGGAVAGLGPDAIDWNMLPLWHWAAWGIILGVALPLDLIALLPLVAGLLLIKAPAVFVVPLVVALEVTSARTLRLIKSYLRVGFIAHYTALTLSLVAAVGALSVWFFQGSA
jgi:hypothetical protein